LGSRSNPGFRSSDFFSTFDLRTLSLAPAILHVVDQRGAVEGLMKVAHQMNQPGQIDRTQFRGNCVVRQGLLGLGDCQEGVSIVG